MKPKFKNILEVVGAILTPLTIIVIIGIKASDTPIIQLPPWVIIFLVSIGVTGLVLLLISFTTPHYTEERILREAKAIEKRIQGEKEEKDIKFKEEELNTLKAKRNLLTQNS